MLSDPQSLVARQVGGDGWTLAEHLLAEAVDGIRMGNWLKSKDGQKGTNRPKPISPWAKKAGKVWGKTDKSPAEVVAILKTMGPAAQEVA